MRILVTGLGFVGSTLVRNLLNEGNRVIGLDNFHKSQIDNIIPLTRNPNFNFFQGDVTNKRDIQKVIGNVDAVIHLAAIVGFPACSRQVALSYEVNVNGTKNIIENMAKDQRLVFASTGSVYGDVKNGLCTEETPTNPVSEYGAQKLLAEKMVTDKENSIAFRFATGMGLSYTTRINLLVNTLCYDAVKNKNLVVFEPDVKRTFIHVEDMSRCFIWGLDNRPSKVYNSGDNNLNFTKRQIAEMIKEKTGVTIFYGNHDKDLDMRNYSVDYSKINHDSFKCKYMMDETIDELLKGVRLIQVKHQYD